MATNNILLTLIIKSNCILQVALHTFAACRWSCSDFLENKKIRRAGKGGSWCNAYVSEIRFLRQLGETVRLGELGVTWRQCSALWWPLPLSPNIIAFKTMGSSGSRTLPRKCKDVMVISLCEREGTKGDKGKMSGQVRKWCSAFFYCNKP